MDVVWCDGMLGQEALELVPGEEHKRKERSSRLRSKGGRRRGIKGRSKCLFSGDKWAI
jgi:hypothetical protein